MTPVPATRMAVALRQMSRSQGVREKRGSEETEEVMVPREMSTSEARGVSSSRQRSVASHSILENHTANWVSRLSGIPSEVRNLQSNTYPPALYTPTTQGTVC